MILKAIVCLMLLANAGRQIAYVDLTRPPKEPPSTASASFAFRGGGLIGHGTVAPLYTALPLSIKLIRFVPSTDRVSWKEAVEIIVTNTGAKAIYLPIGTEDVTLLVPTAKERRYFLLLVRLGDEASDIVGTVMAASNSEHPDSSAILQPGDSVVFKIPFDTRTANARVATRGEANEKLIVQATLYGMDLDGGVDFSEQKSESKTSDNALTWSPSSAC